MFYNLICYSVKLIYKKRLIFIFNKNAMLNSKLLSEKTKLILFTLNNKYIT